MSAVATRWWFFGLWLFAMAMQSTFAHRLHFWGGQPDFLLALALCAALRTDSSTGAICGFFAGLGMASLNGEMVGSLLASRVIAGALAGWAVNRLLRPGVLVVLLGVVVGSIVAGFVFGAAVPRIGLNNWVRSTFVGALHNGVVAIFFALLLKKLRWGNA